MSPSPWADSAVLLLSPATDTEVVGVDGCRAGWLAVARSPRGLIYKIDRSFSDLINTWTSSERIFVDIPIGLPSAAHPARACDVEARRRLGPGRASSVFSPPCRSAAHAPDLAQARELNRREVGKSLSAQAWGICAKIAEVDTVLRAQPALQDLVREVHPELTFWALGGSRPMRFAKKHPSGAAERIALLEQFEPETRDLIDRVLKEHRRAEVGRDDVVDAIAAMLTTTMGTDAVSQIPVEQHFDSAGLAMCMWVPVLAAKQRDA